MSSTSTVKATVITNESFDYGARGSFALSLNSSEATVELA